jgi:hypothetical protein
VGLVSLVWGILAILGLGIGMIPCLGAFNWLNIPFAMAGLVISIIAAAKAPRGANGSAIAGIVLNSLSILIGGVRLMIGGGIV